MSDSYPNQPPSNPNQQTSYSGQPTPVRPGIADPRLEPAVAGGSGFATGFMVAAVFLVVAVMAFTFYTPDQAPVNVDQPVAGQAEPTAGAAAPAGTDAVVEPMVPATEPAAAPAAEPAGDATAPAAPADPAAPAVVVPAN